MNLKRLTEEEFSNLQNMRFIGKIRAETLSKLFCHVGEFREVRDAERHYLEESILEQIRYNPSYRGVNAYRVIPGESKIETRPPSTIVAVSESVALYDLTGSYCRV